MAYDTTGSHKSAREGAEGAQPGAETAPGTERGLGIIDIREYSIRTAGRAGERREEDTPYDPGYIAELSAVEEARIRVLRMDLPKNVRARIFADQIPADQEVVDDIEARIIGEGIDLD